MIKDKIYVVHIVIDKYIGNKVFIESFCSKVIIWQVIIFINHWHIILYAYIVDKNMISLYKDGRVWKN